MATSRNLGRRLPVEELVSAGGVVYRTTATGMEIVLCGRTSAGLWGLPKGTPLAGETLEQTAEREVREETGFDVRIERKVGEIEYWFTRSEQGKRFHKRVHYYLMRPIGGSLDRHDQEYDTVIWCPIQRATRTLTFENEIEMVRQARSLLSPRLPTGNGGSHP